MDGSTTHPGARDCGVFLGRWRIANDRLTSRLNGSDEWERLDAWTMNGAREREQASRPKDLRRCFVERANAGDLDGLVALYEPDAVLAFPPSTTATGAAATREVIRWMLAGGSTFVPGMPRSTLAAATWHSPQPSFPSERPRRTWRGGNPTARGAG